MNRLKGIIQSIKTGWKWVKIISGTIFLLGSFIGIFVYIYLTMFQSDSNGNGQQVANQYSDPATVHPACFLYTAPWEAGELPEIIDCTEEAKSLDYSIGTTLFLQLPENEVNLKPPFVELDPYSNQFLEDLGISVLVVNHGGGGTGIFSSIAMVEVLSETKVRPWITVYQGDRCNDGDTKIINIDKNRIVYSVAATPFRLLNPHDRTDWRRWRLANALFWSSPTGHFS